MHALPKFTKSLQFRIYAVLVLLFALLTTGTLIRSRVIGALDQLANAQVYAGQQGADAYLLASLARRLGAAADDTSRQNISQQIETTIAGFNQIEDAYRSGDSSLGLEALNQPDAMTLLDGLDQEWAAYRVLLQRYLAFDGVARSSLLSQIDDQSQAVFVFTQRLSDSLSVARQSEQTSAQQFTVGSIVAALAIVGLAVYFMTGIVRYIRLLAKNVVDYASGGLASRFPTTSITEIGQLGDALNDMAGNFERTISELEKAVIGALEAQERAERSDKVKSAFLASMSHELRTPLNAIINFTKFVAQGDLGPVNAEQKSTLGEVIDSGKHLLNLINDVLDMSKIESGSLTLFVQENVNVKDILLSILATGKSLAAEKPIEFRSNFSDDLPPIRGDKQRIRQIVLNMMSNACKFTEEGHIELRAYVKDSEMVIVVEDSGPGIAPEDQPAVFESFKQTTSGLRQGGGTGLGMPISKSLAEIHGGRLWLESVAGKGTTFFVALPIKSENLVPMTTS
jgi:signal transduction histidine kinase